MLPKWEWDGPAAGRGPADRRNVRRPRAHLPPRLQQIDIDFIHLPLGEPACLCARWTDDNTQFFLKEHVIDFDVCAQSRDRWSRLRPQAEISTAITHDVVLRANGATDGRGFMMEGWQTRWGFTS
jgi:hypothetical protein